MILDKNIYLCNVDGSRQFYSHTNKSLSSFNHSDSFRMVFFISGSSQILPLPKTDSGLNSNLLIFQYLGKASFSNDLPVSTKDLQTDRIFLPLTHQGYAGKKGLRVRKGNLN